VPESKRRKKPNITPSAAPKKQAASPAWWVPTAVTLMIIGMLWVVVTYVIQAKGPIPGLDNWNLVVGFVLLIAGFLMTLRWH